MATSLASQLQAIKSINKGTPDPIRRPLTRPSVLFDPKEAADLDLRTILSIALSGLEALVELDDRYLSYKDTLFSQTSLELDRGKMVQKDVDKLNRSIHSYLRLLSGNFELPSAFKTVEYLIRRYEVHTYNTDELVLCTLAYHDTHAFVRIVQLLDLRDKKWAFLEGVKISGAPPPRKVIAQQCIRDKGILETLCDYAKPTRKFQHARPVVCFCTAVIVESLGSIPELDSDTVKTVLPFVFDGLKEGSQDHKAGALMIVGLVAMRAILAPKLIQNLVKFIGKVAQQDSVQSTDLPWIRVTIMAIVSLVQSQSAQVYPKETMMDLKETRDFAGVLFGLSREFNIQKFLFVYLETLVEYSLSDASYFDALISILETYQTPHIAEKVVSKLLAKFLKLSHNKDASSFHETGERAKKILALIDKHYSSELHGAVQKFLKNSKMNLRDGESNFKTFCLMFDEGLEMPIDTSDTKLLFSLEHPKAEVRRAALSDIAAAGTLKDISSNPQKLLNVQNSILRRLHDDDLNVVQAALSIGLAGVVNPAHLLRVYREVLVRCMHIMNGSTPATSQACDVAILCMERIVLDIPLHQLDYSKAVASMIFPLLVLPKSWRLNLKVLEMAKQIQWPFYDDSNIVCDPTSSGQAKLLESGDITTINLKTVEVLAETFRKNPERHNRWLVECSRCSEYAKSLFFLIILRASVIHNEDPASVLKLYQVCSSTLKDEWHEMQSCGGIALAEDLNMDKFDKSCIQLVDQLLSCDVETLNIKIFFCIYWCILKACIEAADHLEQLMVADELFVFFASSPSNNIFRKHLQFLVKNCSTAPFPFLSKYFTELGFPVDVQVESLNSLATLFSMYGSSERSSMNENSYLQFLLGFPSLLIPLSSANKELRTAAVNCINGIYKLYCQFSASRVKNGNDTILSRSLLPPTFGVFLESIVSQRELISSDGDFLPLFLLSMLSTSSHNLLVPENFNKRFDQASKDAILNFLLSSALKFSAYGKLVVISLLKDLGSSILHVEGVKKLLFELFERRNICHIRLDKSGQELSKIETEMLCLLLVVCVHPSNSVRADSDILDCLIKSLKVDGLFSDEPAIVQPCIAVLQNLTCSFYDDLESDMQDLLFWNLVCLFRNNNKDIRNAVKEAVLRINIGCSAIVRLLDKILSPDHQNGSPKRLKGQKNIPHCRMTLYQDLDSGEEKSVYLGSLLDILLLKKDIEKRVSLLQPLFQVLEKLFSTEWLFGLLNQCDTESGLVADVPESISSGICYAQQTVLLILNDILESLLLELAKEDNLNIKFNIDILVRCARSTEDVSTRNHVFLLLCSIAKASPRCLSEHVFDIFSVLGESAGKQIDSHSQHVMENLISKLVPCWLSETSSIGELLEIFIKALPDVLEHQRLTLTVYLLRSLGENDSLGVLIYHLLCSLLSRTSKPFQCGGHTLDIWASSEYLSEWEYIFAVLLSSQYSCEVWFLSLVRLLQEIKIHSEHEELFSILYLAMQLIQHKLEDAELFFQLEPGQNPDYLQVALGSLVEQVVLYMQLVNARRKQVGLSRDALKVLKACSNSVLKTITPWMQPSSYFKTIAHLLENSDRDVKKKGLMLLCETIKDHALVQKKSNDKRRRKQKFFAQFHLDENATSSFNELCLIIVQLIASTVNDSETSVKLAAISALEVLSKELPYENLIFSPCLACVVENIGSADLAISSACLRATGALIGVLGSKALAQLPNIMKHMLERAHQISSCPAVNSKYDHLKTSDEILNQRVPLLQSLIITLEAIIENLGGFLNPYLEDILDLLVLHSEYVLELDAKLKLRAAAVRKLLTEKIPVRLLLTPLLKIYSSSLRCGESSLCLVFEMLGSIISMMDRQSIGTYHVKIFEQSLIALDIRRQCPEKVKNVGMVEQSVINAMIVLTMKLTESMFRPLFLHTIEWVDSAPEGSQSVSLDRTITFYKLVNQLVEKHRSLFVPYFKYLLEGCTLHLTDSQDVSVPFSQKRKKMKHGDAHTLAKAKDVLSPNQWHLRALILKSLYQCFLYDATDLKFLDASNFQALLKPIVSQIVVEPPTSTDVPLDTPTVEEVDEILVLCLGQLAVTVRSDVLSKPLNYEVLMQTRNEKVRSRILGLKVVKYLVEHLKEEYLVFLAETIPFLGELLEDAELPVKTLAQEILKELETLSGENLQQYL